MNYTRAIIISVIAGFAILLLMIGVATTQTVPTGKVSATTVNYSIFSTFVGIVVILITFFAIKHESKKSKFL